MDKGHLKGGNINRLSPLNVFIDGNIFTLQKIGGISKYWIKILEHFIEDPGIGKILLRIYKGADNNIYLNGFLEEYAQQRSSKLILSISKFPPPDNFNYRSFWRSLYKNFELLRSSFKNGKLKFDIYHSTYYSAPEVICRAKKVFVTFYDTIHEDYLSKINGRKSAEEVLKLKRKALNNCDNIICISKTTKEKLLSNHQDINSKQVSYIYLGVDEVFKDYSQNINRTKKKYGLDYQYFLFVGNRNLYKNFDILFESYQEFIKIYPDVKLVLVGGEEEFSDTQKKCLDKNKKLQKNIYIFRDITDADLAVLYHLSISFISTSLMEGFGIPILEAMGAGTNIILSDIEVHKEIAGECAFYFDPGSIDDLLQKMIAVYQDKKSLKDKYPAHLSRFTWAKCAEETLQAYLNSR